MPTGRPRRRGRAWPSRRTPRVASATTGPVSRVPANTRCVWTSGLGDLDAAVRLLPSAHGEGRFVADESVVAKLVESGQVALRYAADRNFNGSIDRIAGICDASGLVLGLMPHPERYTRWTQHPTWTRLSADTRSGDPLGLRMFRNAVHHATMSTA